MGMVDEKQGIHPNDIIGTIETREYRMVSIFARGIFQSRIGSGRLAAKNGEGMCGF